MRIISGQFKGKKILEAKDKNTRPLKDLVKESIFNIIKHSNKFKINIEQVKILDLFSGTGSFGLEALSRGANEVTFIENYPPVLEILKRNIKNLNLHEKCKIIEKYIFKDFNFEKLNQSYDVIFIDPPYKEKKISTLLSKIYEFKILRNNGILVLHRNNKNKENLIENFKIIEEKNYGISKIIFGNFI